MARRGDAAGICVAAAAARLAFARAVTLLATLAVMQLVCSGSVRAQTQEQEADRIPGIPGGIDRGQFSARLRRPGRRSLGSSPDAASRTPSTTLATCSAIRSAASSRGTRYMGRLEFAACCRHGESHRLERAHLLHQRLSDPWAEHLGAQPRRPDAGELHRGVAVDAAIRAVAGARSCMGENLTLRFGQLSADSEFVISQGASAFLNGSWGWPSIIGINLPDGGPAYPLAAPAARLAFNPNDTLGFLIGVFSGDPASDCEDLPQVCNPNGLDFPFSQPLLLYRRGHQVQSGRGRAGRHVEAGHVALFRQFFTAIRRQQRSAHRSRAGAGRARGERSRASTPSSTR